MIYPGNFRVDSCGRLTECPVCGSTEFSADSRFCKTCGLSRYNLCVPEDGSDPHENPLNARFCEQCGARTTFFLQKLLLPWRQVYREAKKEASPQTDEAELPF